MTYLFIVMDDERRAHPEYLESAQAVCDAVKRSVFDYRDGAEWLPEHIEEAAGLTETLLEDGKLSFEGDAPIYLFQLADGVALPATASEAHRLADEFYNGTAKKDWAMWAQEAVVILERAAAAGVGEVPRG